MGTKKFKGELKYIEPYRLLKKDKNNEIDNFFLVLAVVFNDLKGIDFFERIIIDTYKQPIFEEISVHSGEYSGILTQTRKILISNLQEFLLFLRKNEKILLSAEFKDILSKTNKDIQNKWNNIVDIAFDNKSENIHDFTEYLIKVRNNIAFHYYQPKGFKKAFCNFFYKKDRIKQNDFAYYSLGEEIETTRYYYADAAVQEYLRSTTDEDVKVLDFKYRAEIGMILSNVSLTILRLQKAYLKNRPK